MKSKNRKRLVILLLLYFVLMLCLHLENVLQKNMSKIVITPDTTNGEVVFRGALVDDEWYNPKDMVTSLKGWRQTGQDLAVRSVTGDPLELTLPIGESRQLVFNNGSGTGSVEISVGNGIIYSNLQDSHTISTGLLVELPLVMLSSKLLLNTVGAAVVGLLAVCMLLFNLHCRKKRGNTVTANTANNKNAAVEFLRFFIIMCVVVHHYCSFVPGGYLGVDFYFVLSGFLLMRHYERHGGNTDKPYLDALVYTKERYFRLLPNYLFAFFLSYILWICLAKDTGLVGLFENNIWELLMLEAFGFTEFLMVAPGWYCSALLIAGFFVYVLLSKCRKSYLQFIAPISLFVILAYISHNFGQLNQHLQFAGFTTTGVLRGFAELGLGCICYVVHKSLLKKPPTCMVSTLVELFCIIYICVQIFDHKDGKRDFICLLAIAVLTTSLFVGNSLWSKLLNHRWANYLGSISIGIYLNHFALAFVNWWMLCAKLDLTWWFAFVLYLCVVVVFSAISTQFVKNLLVRKEMQM